MIACTLGPLAGCGPRELVKVNVESATDWAIVGVPGPGIFPIVFLTGQDAPCVVNAKSDPVDFETYLAAKYGRDYWLAHDPSGPCQIGDGRLSKIAGTLVLTEKVGWHLLVNDSHHPSRLRWFDLQSGKLTNDLGSNWVAFGNWTLRIRPSELVLLSYFATG
jgi:hypothetical protein